MGGGFSHRTARWNKKWQVSSQKGAQWESHDGLDRGGEGKWPHRMGGAAGVMPSWTCELATPGCLFHVSLRGTRGS